MAEFKHQHQQQNLQAGLQPLALRNQDLVLQHQAQEALVAVQALEHQRLGQSTQDQVGGQRPLHPADLVIHQQG